MEDGVNRLLCHDLSTMEVYRKWVQFAAAARRFRASRHTVRKWLRRFSSGPYLIHFTIERLRTYTHGLGVPVTLRLS